MEHSIQHESYHEAGKDPARSYYSFYLHEMVESASKQEDILGIATVRKPNKNAILEAT